MNEDYIIELDNTRVAPLFSPKKVTIESRPRIIQQPVLQSDNRTSWEKQYHRRKGEAKIQALQREELKDKTNKAVWGTIGLGALAAALFTPAAPYIDTAFALNGAYNLGNLYDKGTLGLNLETAENALLMAPLGLRGVPYAIKGYNYATTKLPEIYNTVVSPVKDSFTRGVKKVKVKAINPIINNIQSKVISPSIEYVKNTYNRYTAPKTNIVMTPYKGNLFLLSKYRLRNGGFDKLGITPDDVIYVPKGHPMYVEPNNRFMSHLESPVNARKFLLKSEAIPLIDEYKGIASYSGSTKLFTQPTVGKWGTIDKETKLMTGHEFLHAIDDVIKSKNISSTNAALAKFSPKKGINLDKVILESNYVNPPGTDFSKIPSKISRYLRNNKGTELHARLGLIKNWFGITDPHQPITPDMWNYARRHYVNSLGGLDNNMQQMFRAVTDPKKFLDWINPRVASQTGIIGLGSYSVLNE